MKSSAFASMFVGFTALGVAFAACSPGTATSPGSAGGGGAASRVSSSGASGGEGGTGAATSSTTASGASGGGDVCTQACEKAESCPAPVCGFMPFDCADPRDECGAQCLLDATCDQIATLPTGSMDRALVGCLLGCQQRGGGGAPPSNRDCGLCALPCLESECVEPACIGWAGCVQLCYRNDPRPTCFRACDAAFPDAVVFYGRAYDCTCSQCVDVCEATIDPCRARPRGTGGMCDP
jgi:hypothetical protein